MELGVGDRAQGGRMRGRSCRRRKTARDPEPQQRVIQSCRARAGKVAVEEADLGRKLEFGSGR